GPVHLPRHAGHADDPVALPDIVGDRAGGGTAGRLRRRRAQRGPAPPGPVPRVPGLPRGPAGLEELAGLAGRGRARRGPRGAGVRLAAGGVAPVVAYATWFHHENGSYSLSRADGFYLWGRVSSFAECSVIKPPADELKICPSGTPSSRTPPGDYIWHAPQVHQ